MAVKKEQSEQVTWISSQSLVRLRTDAGNIPLYTGKIHAKQGGAYVSSFKGRGMEFDESRIYMPGDDIRNMDWRVTARTGEAHTKVYQEERERPVLLWLDLNPSMFFATQGAYKSVIATKAATLLAWCVANHNDRVGALVFAGDEHIEIKPRRGKSAVLNFINRTVNHSAWNNGHWKNENRTNRNMEISMSRLRKVTHPGSLIFLISDFREMNELSTSHLANISRHNDIVLVHVYDPIESELPTSGFYKVSDGTKEININAADKTLREDYHQRFVEHTETLKTLCRQNRMHLINLATDNDVLESLQNGLGNQSPSQLLLKS